MQMLPSFALSIYISLLQDRSNQSNEFLEYVGVTVFSKEMIQQNLYKMGWSKEEQYRKDIN